MIRNLIEVVCTICGDTEVFQSPRPIGWLTISVENSYEDRAWTDHHICPDCRRLIAAAEKASEKEAK